MSRFSIILDICTRDTRVARWIFIFQFLYILLKWNHFLAFWRTVVGGRCRAINYRHAATLVSYKWSFVRDRAEFYNGSAVLLTARHIVNTNVYRRSYNVHVHALKTAAGPSTQFSIIVI